MQTNFEHHHSILKTTVFEDLKTLPPGKAKELALRFFPVLGRVLEEDKAGLAPEVKPAPTPISNSVDLAQDNNKDWQSDYGNTNEISDEKPAAAVNKNQANSLAKTGSQGQHTKALKLKEFLSRLDVVIKQITQLAGQHTNFDQVAGEMNIKVAPLIASYGIRWNIKYQSYRKAIDVREVIDCLLKEDQGQNQPGNFEDAFFLPCDWKEINNLNRELEVFVNLTLQMEGDQPTSAHLLPKYLELKDQLSKKLSGSNKGDTLYPMFHAMLQRVIKYLDKAMACETLLIYL
ncbi:hypothetical protein PTTG_09583 [Puccinia triticina 1-1 BBBD Race 1]|uniref:Uncharacterized protein n=1 Tax=Puccinia triticina (isolate 1-1 / race 1 (BBBD)) TaxID=630390 RepID=A0A0C4F8S9_PUCT1|nr:hypothetical protein PTTG_09583 [Puccinia triticina 1-1 BBBD Race 1]